MPRQCYNSTDMDILAYNEAKARMSYEDKNSINFIYSINYFRHFCCHVINVNSSLFVFQSVLSFAFFFFVLGVHPTCQTLGIKGLKVFKGISVARGRGAIVPPLFNLTRSVGTSNTFVSTLSLSVTDSTCIWIIKLKN